MSLLYTSPMNLGELVALAFICAGIIVGVPTVLFCAVVATAAWIDKSRQHRMVLGNPDPAASRDCYKEAHR